MSYTEIFSDEKRWRLRTKGQRKRGKLVAVITNIEGKKIWDELGSFLGIFLVGFSAYGPKIEGPKIEN